MQKCKVSGYFCQKPQAVIIRVRGQSSVETAPAKATTVNSKKKAHKKSNVFVDSLNNAWKMASAVVFFTKAITKHYENSTKTSLNAF